MEYAEILDLPLAYSSNGRGIVEHDYDTGLQQHRSTFPGPEEAWRRYQDWKGIHEPEVAEAILLPFNRDLRNPDGTVKEPRYYQRIAIQRAVGGAMSARQRMLITMATGTGKTFVAMQIVSKLRQSGWTGDRKPRVLYLADRNILVDQPMDREFLPAFGEAVWKVSGDSKTGREIYFALYQSIADSKEGPGIFRDYPKDYFDLIIVDECHRGSARDDSTWRAFLEHFEPAVQIGMTATPRREDENLDTYSYFGNPIYEYSLAQGIEDGFLAPYLVHRVVLSPDASGWSPTPEQLDLFGREIPDDLYTTPDFERVVSLLVRTRAAARHLTEYMTRTDRMAKTIVFCVNQEHAEQMRMELHNANVDMAKQFPHYVARIVSDEGEVGRALLDDFTDPERDVPVIVTTSKLLSTGVDVPTCRNIVLFKPIGSMVEFKQIIGRGTRLFPDQDKLFFRIIDYAGATHLFADPDFDGVPGWITDEEIDDEGRTVGGQVVAEPGPTYDEEGPIELSPEELEAQGAKKYYVDEGEVFVTAEALYVLEPEGGTLRVVAYEQYVADQVRRAFPDVNGLRRLWRTHDGRNEVVETMEQRGIAFDELARRTGLIEADPFDLLVHVAWNGPLSSRRDRASRLRADHGQFLDEFSPAAREVLDELLEKYADHGIDQLDDLHVLEVPPLSEFGTPVEIADRFGGAEKLRAAVGRLEELLYAA